MGFRFQRRIKIIPGVTLNLSKGGISTSIGVRGAHVTLGRGKQRVTVGIPGTGVSYTDVESTRPHALEAGKLPLSVTTEAPGEANEGASLSGLVWLVVVGLVVLTVILAH